MRNSSKAFTLIELLIVVAIIAILAAIAVPNFLEAQTRSKVSRAQADMRSLAVGIEAFAVDNNKPPSIVAPTSATGCAGPDFNCGPGLLNGPSVFYPDTAGVSSRFIAITTPIAYISSVFRDPFINPAVRFSISCNGTAPFPEYDTYDFVDSYTIHPDGPYPLFSTGANAERAGGLSSGASWHIVSPGPDGENCFGGGHVGQVAFHDGGVDYDPTNGTLSRGDIVRIGSAPGEVFNSFLPKYDRARNRVN